MPRNFKSDDTTEKAGVYLTEKILRTDSQAPSIPATQTEYEINTPAPQSKDCLILNTPLEGNT